MVPECRRPEPCSCWGCINEELERYKRWQWEVRPLDQLGLPKTEGVDGDGDCE